MELNFFYFPKAMLSMKIQLSSLAEVLGIEVIYRHIKKRPKNDSFISLVKLSTSPPKVIEKFSLLFNEWFL